MFKYLHTKCKMSSSNDTTKIGSPFGAAKSPLSPRSPTPPHTCQVCSDTTRFSFRPQRCPLAGKKIELPEAGEELYNGNSTSSTLSEESEHRFRLVLPVLLSNKTPQMYLSSGEREPIERWIEHCRNTGCKGFENCGTGSLDSEPMSER